MATEEPWAEDVEKVFHNFDGFTAEDEERLLDADYGIDRLEEAWHDGFVNPDLDTEDRNNARNSFLSWMGYLGYDPSDFDWKAWHDWLYGK